MSAVQDLADGLSLGSVLEKARARFGGYELIDHWTQGEFHHDVVLRIDTAANQLPGQFLVVATNCNGGVKEVLCFGELPNRWALWHWRCPNVDEFSGALPPILDRATTQHWFDPCELLRPDARSEVKEEFCQRQRGGGWELVASACGKLKKD